MGLPLLMIIIAKFVCESVLTRASGLFLIDKENMDEVRALLLHSVGHQLLLGALGADDVLTVRDEALPHHAGLAGRADEAVVVPVAALERDEPRASDSSDGFAARRASL